MRIKIFFLLAWMGGVALPAAYSQSSEIDTTINLDLLKAPSSPAFNLLGISPSLVERPTDITSFKLSLQNATSNFTGLPNSYAIEVAPFLMKRKKYTLDTYDDSRKAIPQTFLLSAGYTRLGPEGAEDVDSLISTKVAFGLKFSIIRPKWSKETRKAYQELVASQKELMKEYHQLEENNENHALLLRLRKERVQLNAVPEAQRTPEQRNRVEELKSAMDSLEVLINDDINETFSNSSQAHARTKEAALNIRSERFGFFMDFSGGVVFDFPGNGFNNSSTQKAGAWLTFGQDHGNKGVTSMFILRYLYQPESIFADPSGNLSTAKLSTFDAGGRLLINAAENKFSLSSELLYRSILGSSAADPSWRVVLNASYDIGFNQKITFAFGRNFDGTISKDGNLIAALNFIAGWGSRRKITD